MTGWNADNAAGPTGQGAVTLVEGSSFCISQANGDILPAHPHGVFYEDTRILSLWSLAINGRPLEPLGAWTPAPYQGTHIGRAAQADGGADSPLTVERKRELGTGIQECITIHNYGLEPAFCELMLSVDADFADLFEVKDGRVRRQWEQIRRPQGDSLRIDALWQGTKKNILVHAPGAEAGTEGLLFRTTIPAHAEWSVRVSAVPVAGDTESLAPLLHAPLVTVSPQEQRLKAWDAGIPSTRLSNPSVDKTLLRSHQDLGALRIVDPAHPDRMVVAAGAPWFMALFGRDSLLASIMIVPLDPTLALGTLQTLADRQGTAVDPLTEEQPGRILHEVRLGVGTGLALGGKSAYYGTADATPLFVTLLGEASRWGLASADIATLAPHADRALDWIRDYGDRDGDGFVEYERLNDQGLINQG
ncbi:amylo-alpha-1,6-glucosidase [Arthrobacter sp. MMS18-M83]|uniref:amylo-alpha-1,6-glucosidase n=1 Tax=Arthrobacter sp. MMS18-M83 TaxID=2996261 RepID=UPI003FA3A6B1